MASISSTDFNDAVQYVREHARNMTPGQAEWHLNDLRNSVQMYSDPTKRENAQKDLEALSQEITKVMASKKRTASAISSSSDEATSLSSSSNKRQEVIKGIHLNQKGKNLINLPTVHIYEIAKNLTYVEMQALATTCGTLRDILLFSSANNRTLLNFWKNLASSSETVHISHQAYTGAVARGQWEIARRLKKELPETTKFPSDRFLSQVLNSARGIGDDGNRMAPDPTLALCLLRNANALNVIFSKGLPASLELYDKFFHDLLDAAAKSDLLVLIQLIVGNPDIQSRFFFLDHSGKNDECGLAVCHAAENGHVDVVNYLMEKLGKNKITRLKESLEIAAKKNRLQVVQYFIENARDQFESASIISAFHLAIQSQCFEVVQYLMHKEKATINLLSALSPTTSALAIAATVSPEIMQYIAEQGTFLPANYGAALLAATKAGLMSNAIFLIQQQGGITPYHYLIPYDDCASALYTFAQEGHLEGVQCFIQQRREQFFPGVYGCALYYAAKNGHFEIVKYLMAEKGDQIDLPSLKEAGEEAKTPEIRTFLSELTLRK